MTRRWNWGTGIAAVYAAFATATVSFVVFALRQHVDLVSTDYYAQSLAHDDRLAASARAAAAPGTYALDIAPDGRRIDLRWTAARPESGRLTLYRPSQSAADRVFPLVLNDDGRQTVHLDDLAAGAWTLQIDWSSPAGAFYVERRLVLR
jgi:nitrogen fixation protein FixH